MKKIIITLCIALAGQLALAQSNKTAAVISSEFVETIKLKIKDIIQVGYQVELLYDSRISAEGKLINPLVFRQKNYTSDTENDHTNSNFLVAIKPLLKDGPAWKPAVDKDQNKPAEDNVRFTVIIKNNKITIEQKDSAYANRF